MKSSRFFYGAIALLALVACSKKTETQQEKVVPVKVMEVARHTQHRNGAKLL